MLKKGFKQLLAEANAVIDSVSVHEALELLAADDAVFIDVREPHERQQGFIPGSVHVPRGFLEFVADPEGPSHEPAFAAGKQLVVYCGTGGRSALSCKTLVDMGFGQVLNLVGGIEAWRQARGPIER